MAPTATLIASVLSAKTNRELLGALKGAEMDGARDGETKAQEAVRQGVRAELRRRYPATKGERGASWGTFMAAHVITTLEVMVELKTREPGLDLEEAARRAEASVMGRTA